MSISAKVKRDILRHMLRIRRVQERIEGEYMQDRMKTPVHLCVGQEAIAAGVCLALRRDDSIQSNHRSHGHYLAKGGNLNALIAELHCKKTGCSKGYGGSMHVVDTSVGHLGSSSIVGGGIPIGAGIGLAFQMQKTDKVSVTFFGDGAADEGVLYESVNFSMLKKLPVVFVLEDNHWAVCSPRANRQMADNVFLKGAPKDLLFAAKIDGNDAELVYKTAKKAVDRARKGLGPSLIVCDTYRILGHAGCKAQDPAGYRDACEVEEWCRQCPLDRFREACLAGGSVDAATLEAWEREIGDEIEAAFRFAIESPLPGPEDLHNHLFSE